MTKLRLKSCSGLKISKKMSVLTQWVDRRQILRGDQNRRQILRGNIFFKIFNFLLDFSLLYDRTTTKILFRPENFQKMSVLTQWVDRRQILRGDQNRRQILRGNIFFTIFNFLLDFSLLYDRTMTENLFGLENFSLGILLWVPCNARQILRGAVDRRQILRGFFFSNFFVSPLVFQLYMTELRRKSY